MKAKNILLLIAAIVAMITVLYSFMGSQDQTAYINEIEKEREDKDRFMRTSRSLHLPGMLSSMKAFIIIRRMCDIKSQLI